MRNFFLEKDYNISIWISNYYFYEKNPKLCVNYYVSPLSIILYHFILLG